MIEPCGMPLTATASRTGETGRGRGTTAPRALRLNPWDNMDPHCSPPITTCLHSGEPFHREGPRAPPHADAALHSGDIGLLHGLRHIGHPFRPQRPGGLHVLRGPRVLRPLPVPAAQAKELSKCSGVGCTRLYHVLSAGPGAVATGKNPYFYLRIPKFAGASLAGTP